MAYCMLWTANIFIFTSVLFTPIALGTRLWTREYFNFAAIGTTGTGFAFFAQSDSFIGAGLFSLVIENNPFTYPLRTGTYNYGDCKGNSIYDYTIGVWGCKELYQAGAATFAMNIIALLIYFIIFVISIVFTGCTGRKGARWYQHPSLLCVVLFILPIGIVLQLIGVFVWLGRGNAAVKDFAAWWVSLPLGPLGVLHTLSSSYALACASLATAFLAWLLFLVSWCTVRRSSTKSRMAPAFDPNGLPAAAPIDAVVAPPAPPVEYGIGPNLKSDARYGQAPQAPLGPPEPQWEPPQGNVYPTGPPPAPGTYPPPWSPPTDGGAAPPAGGGMYGPPPPMPTGEVPSVFGRRT